MGWRRGTLQYNEVHPLAFFVHSAAEGLDLHPRHCLIISLWIIITDFKESCEPKRKVKHERLAAEKEFYDNREELSADFKIIAVCKNIKTNSPEYEQ